MRGGKREVEAVPSNYGHRRVASIYCEEHSGATVEMTYSSQRHDRDEAERKPECSIPVEEVRDEAERNEEEEDIWTRASNLGPVYKVCWLQVIVKALLNLTRTI